MCGICGFNFEDRIILKKMTNLIKHRGPDDFGYFTDKSISLGMRRLSIIDLEKGNQPQHNEDETIWIVFNGEIYNFLELREELIKKGHKFYTNSDTEVIIHGYEEWGNNCVNKLRGQFVFCVYDSNLEILFLARDHLGLKPLYYFFDGKNFVFGSEIKCILLHDVERTIDKQALNFYISLGYTPFEHTLFENIYKLPSSSYLIFDLKKKEYNIKEYWKLKFKIRERNEEQLAKELRNLLEQSVKLRLISDVPIGAFLSGGIDSSIVVALMSKYMKEPVKTFSIGFEQYAPVNETKYAKYVSDFFNTDHTELTIESTCYNILPKLVWYLDDLISDPAIIPVYFMSKLARTNIKVALTGDGADEIFAGYASQYRLNKRNYYKFIPKQLLNLTAKFYYYIPSHLIQFLFSEINSLARDEEKYFRPVLMIKNIEKPIIFPFKVDNIQFLFKNKLDKNLGLINHFINYDIKYQLPNLYNVKTDKMSMAASLEARVPFLDPRIVEWSSTINPNLKIKNRTEKYILRLAVKDLIPHQILKRKKLGFGTPVNMWIKTGMKEVSQEILERLGKRKGLINETYIRKVKKNRFLNLYQNRVWSLIMFELWYETFMEKKKLEPVNL